MSDEPLKIGPYTFQSRLIVGTGKYADFATMERALAASGADCVTVAIRRVDFSAKETLLDHIDRARVTILPNTAGCYTAEEALRTARLARELLDTPLIKLEVIADQKTLLPDPVATLEAARVLVKEGFVVMAYTSDDPIVARHLQEAGAASVMPLGSAIGSGMGILNRHNIRLIVDMLQVPVIVDAGVGTASDVTIAFELGVAGVLLNTGIALADDPVRMARAMRLAAESGREACAAGRIPMKPHASASSPMKGMVGG
ncbi:MAG: thiazole synthase [Planctomycetes bacterium]|nr:thiazole synthase [Planctomycetota bacterium]